MKRPKRPTIGNTHVLFDELTLGILRAILDDTQKYPDDTEIAMSYSSIQLDIPRIKMSLSKEELKKILEAIEKAYEKAGKKIKHMALVKDVNDLDSMETIIDNRDEEEIH
jgi:hypothetical protein